MRIISNYRDYYDCCQDYTDDNMWRRKKSELETFKIQSDIHFDHRFTFIGFCGSIYPVYIDYTKAWYKRHTPSNVNFKGFSAANMTHHKFLRDARVALDDMPDEDLVSRDIKISYTIPTVERSAPSRYMDWGLRAHQKNKSWIDEMVNSNLLKDLFLERRTPIFTLTYKSSDDWIYNQTPILENYQFYQVFDTYTAYQEIDMFKNNQLVMMDDPMQITDNVVLRDSKGFDKWSFKTMPTKRK